MSIRPKAAFEAVLGPADSYTIAYAAVPKGDSGSNHDSARETSAEFGLPKGNGIRCLRHIKAPRDQTRCSLSLGPLSG